MIKMWLRWLIPLCGLLAIGPLAALCTFPLRAADGSAAATPLVSDSPVSGLARGLAALLLAGAVGAVGTVVNGARSGLFATGLVLAWAAWGTGTMDDIMRHSPSSSTLWRLATEGVLLGGVAFLISCGLLALSGRVRVDVGSPGAQPDASAEGIEGPSKMSQALTALGVTLAVGMAATWLVAQEAIKGQAFAAAVCAGVFGTLAGRFSAPRAPVYAYMGAILLLAALGPVVGALSHSGETAILRAALAGELVPPARLVPFDWIAGAFVGVPMGLNLAAALGEVQLKEA